MTPLPVGIGFHVIPTDFQIIPHPHPERVLFHLDPRIRGSLVSLVPPLLETKNKLLGLKILMSILRLALKTLLGRRKEKSCWDERMGMMRKPRKSLFLKIPSGLFQVPGGTWRQGWGEDIKSGTSILYLSLPRPLLWSSWVPSLPGWERRGFPIPPGNFGCRSWRWWCGRRIMGISFWL